MDRYMPVIASGMTFGAAMVASGLSSPQIMLDQLALRNNSMVLTYIVASMASTLLIYSFNSTGYVKASPRSNSSLGWFGMYDANVIGGMLQGFGMVLCGACPTSLISQVAFGDSTALWAFGGGIIGAVIFVLYADRLKSKKARSGQIITLSNILGVTPEAGTALYLSILAVLLTYLAQGWSGIAPDSPKAAVLGGMMISVAQAASLFLSQRSLGISSAYQEAAGVLVRCLQGGELSVPISNVVFALAVMTGARLITFTLALDPPPHHQSSRSASFLGGLISIFGSRLAGGCTSGHGLSGVSSLSISSFVTAASMAVGGLSLSALL